MPEVIQAAPSSSVGDFEVRQTGNDRSAVKVRPRIVPRTAVSQMQSADRKAQSDGCKDGASIAATTGVGLAHRVGSFRPIALLRGFGVVPGFRGAFQMEYQTLKNSIATLQKLRDVHYSQLDAGALAELDDVLRQLRNVSESSQKREHDLGKLLDRALRVTDIVIRAVSNLTDWMK
ncbi:hypothetical protein [Diaphorobacter nitroreducens]|uniref:hypothetical protein n=1 Tax=Diaphorobacter nitroreducens TaxID=164759 RepID=UPI0028A2632C|nr:hypothetical protein [Diaphorobacter nitroreducens]